MKRGPLFLALPLFLAMAAPAHAQEAFLTPAENLVVDGVPKIPALLAIVAAA